MIKLNSVFIFSFILFVSNIYLCHSMYIYVDPTEKKCLSQFKLADSTVDITYFINGEVEDKNIISFEDHNHVNLLRKVDTRKGRIENVNIEREGVYYFCVENYSKFKFTLTFNIQEEYVADNVLSIKTVENFISAIDNLDGKLGKINFGLKNSVIRKTVHFKILKDVNFKVNIYTFIKIAFLIIFAVFQICMITSIFKNVKIVSNIAVNNNENTPLKEKKKPQGIDFL